MSLTDFQGYAMRTSEGGRESPVMIGSSRPTIDSQNSKVEGIGLTLEIL